MIRRAITALLVLGATALGGGVAAENAGIDLRLASKKTQVTHVSGGVFGGTARIQPAQRGNGNRELIINAPGASVNLSWCGLAAPAGQPVTSLGRTP